MTTLMEMSGIRAGYGGVRVLDDVAITVEEGEFVVLLGPNGAGKSTTLKVLSGLLKPAAGSVAFAGKDITRVPGFRRTGLGIGHVPEARRIFPDHTVLENLQLGSFPLRRNRARTQKLMDEVLELFPVLAQRRDQAGGTLSGGEAQMLAVARALMSEPKLLVLDEPSLGLAPLKAAELFSYIKRLHSERGISVLLVEQLAMIALRLADRAYVLERGRIGLSGTAKEVEADPKVKSLYLGGESAA